MGIRSTEMHRVSAIPGEEQGKVDFYAGVLGVTLVKKAVSCDDPSTDHLYYGDGAGNPGTIMTFSTWPGAMRGQTGAGQVTATSFAIPEDSLGYWTERLVQHGVRFGRPERRLDETVLSVLDPDGLAIELVTRPGGGESGGEVEPWVGSPVPRDHAMRGISGVTLSEGTAKETGDLLTGFLGFDRAAEGDGGRARYAAGASFADVLDRPGERMGRVAVGSVHHVAWRAPDEETHKEWREEIAARGFNVTQILDRNYFRALYFREPGGVLFEIATDPPGFAVDEDPGHLGESLMLPPWLEGDRERIERALPPIKLPHERG